MVLSEHARIRLQQRGLPRRVVDWLAAYGEVDHQPSSQLYWFTQRSRRALERDLGRRMLKRHEKALNAYMVCADGQVATVGHRYQRIVRH
jgi:hypothetical protein